VSVRQRVGVVRGRDLIKNTACQPSLPLISIEQGKSFPVPKSPATRVLLACLSSFYSLSSPLPSYDKVLLDTRSKFQDYIYTVLSSYHITS